MPKTADRQTDGFSAPAGRQIGTVHMSKEPSQPKTKPCGSYFCIQPHPGGVKGAESTHEISNTSNNDEI